jgi:hypothetical protein
MNEKIYQRIELKVTAEQHAKLKANAELAMLPLSKYMLKLSEELPVYYVKDFAEVCVQLKKMGANLNQIVKIVNSQKYANKEANTLLKSNLEALTGITKVVNKIALKVNCDTKYTATEKEKILIDNLEKIKSDTSNVIENLKRGV